MQPNPPGYSVTGAAELAREFLADLKDRWAHSQGVAEAAERAGAGLDRDDREALVGAAWLHDIGYSPACIRTGLHALDGAIELAEHGLPLRVTALVAHHSMSAREATQRGLEGGLERFPLERGHVADALTWADMTTDPRGHPTSVDDRITEILERYPQAHPVHEAISAGAADIIAAVRRTEQRMAALVS